VSSDGKMEHNSLSFLWSWLGRKLGGGGVTRGKPRVEVYEAEGTLTYSTLTLSEV
jgi:hypothetical protein